MRINPSVAIRAIVFPDYFLLSCSRPQKEPSKSNRTASEQNDISWGEHFCVSDNLFNEGKYPSPLLCPLGVLFMEHNLLHFGAPRAIVFTSFSITITVTINRLHRLMDRKRHSPTITCDRSENSRRFMRVLWSISVFRHATQIFHLSRRCLSRSATRFVPSNRTTKSAQSVRKFIPSQHPLTTVTSKRKQCWHSRKRLSWNLKHTLSCSRLKLSSQDMSVNNAVI